MNLLLLLHGDQMVSASVDMRASCICQFSMHRQVQKDALRLSSFGGMLLMEAETVQTRWSWACPRLIGLMRLDASKSAILIR